MLHQTPSSDKFPEIFPFLNLGELPHLADP